MVDESIIKLVKDYINELLVNGIKINKAILYGSYARGEATKDSDIDLLLISPLFDKKYTEHRGKIWSLTKISDFRIELLPVGEKRYIEDNISHLLEIARREGIVIVAN